MSAKVRVDKGLKAPPAPGVGGGGVGVGGGAVGVAGGDVGEAVGDGIVQAATPSAWKPSDWALCDRVISDVPVPLKKTTPLPGGFGFPSSRSMDNVWPLWSPTTCRLTAARMPPVGAA
ncbi:MAG: hypothetical protein E6I38_11555 [Chloroflexi bacterium]|nr:MAG: hypothetical protein E6I38_11555 [Chloroflexota bacterium]